MKVVVYGATGKTGSRVIKELLQRGHEVVAVARDSAKLTPQAGVLIKQDDLSDPATIAEVIKGFDAVVSAYAPPSDNTDQLIGVTERQIAGVK